MYSTILYIVFMAYENTMPRRTYAPKEETKQVVN